MFVSLPRNAYWVTVPISTSTEEDVIGKIKIFFDERLIFFHFLQRDTASVFRIYSRNSTNSISANTQGVSMPMRQRTLAWTPQRFSAALGLASNPKDHLTILLRNKEDKKLLGSRVPFDLPALISAINYLRNFKVLKLVKYTRAKVEFVCLLSIIYTVCFTTSDV